MKYSKIIVTEIIRIQNRLNSKTSKLYLYDNNNNIFDSKSELSSATGCMCVGGGGEEGGRCNHPGLTIPHHCNQTIENQT